MKNLSLSLFTFTLACCTFLCPLPSLAQTTPLSSLCPSCTVGQSPAGAAQNKPAPTKSLVAAPRLKSMDGSFLLDFEGLGNQDQLNGFYAGGTSGQGFSGVDYGITFSGSSLSLIDQDAGGTGNFANEPSASTVLFSLSSELVANVPTGFGTGVSFYYAAQVGNLTVSVYSGEDATGDLLAQGSYASFQMGTVGGDPTGTFDKWVGLNLPITSNGKSVVIAGVANQFVFDDFQVGALRPDQDGDNVIDESDNCLTQANFSQTDSDGDGTGDACEICPDDPSCVIVHCESGSAYSSIQEAVNALSPTLPATLLIPPGAYDEDVNFGIGNRIITVVVGDSCDE